ncbi:MAG: hypothetical protein PHT12_02860 [Patescibacteria group bacterium]|nr:hypothetical protein [Patescibacteria group bacterium]
MNIAFPIGLILLPYFALIVGVFGVGIFAMMHFVRYGATTRASFIAVTLWLAGTAFILGATYFAVVDTDWKHPLNIGLSAGSISFSPPSP